MIYKLNFKHSRQAPEQRIFFFSDFHKGHNKNFIYEKRGFKDVFEHDATLIERWNNKIKNTDIVFLLGDTCVGENNGPDALDDLLKLLNFNTIYVMPGNHPRGYKQSFDRETIKGETFDKYLRLVYYFNNKKVCLIPNYYEIIVNDKLICLSHYPIKCHNEYVRGSFAIHGHVHGSFHDSLPTTLDNGKILDVGPESVKEPLDFDEICAIMDKKCIRKDSHHTVE